MSRVRILGRAQRDLADMRDWIDQDNPSRAVSFVLEMFEHFHRLAKRPLIGRARPEMARRRPIDAARPLCHFYRLNESDISI